ncbi:hypothetical protein ABBQ38_007873 [Trebouxia sp. C0009 RCD-2024]
MPAAKKQKPNDVATERTTDKKVSPNLYDFRAADAAQELGPWCAAAVLRELLRPRQTNNLLDTPGPPENKYADDCPDSAAIKKTPGAYITNPVAGVANGDPRGGDSEQHDSEMTDVFPVNKPAPITPEIQALNVALKEVARMLAQALPISKRLRLASSFALGEIDPAAHNFKVLLRHVISRVIDAIPSKLLDRELGLPPAAEVEELPSEAQQAKHGDQAHSKNKAEKESQAQQAKQATALDGDPEEEEEGRDRLPLFSHKVMTFVQHLLKYKDDVTKSKQAAYRSPEEAANQHWSAILFVTRKMTAMGLGAMFKHAPCLKAWRAATLVGYGGSVSASCLTSKAQHEVLQQLKAGELDIVISTAVAEEGLDVKQCQLVIRFDLPSTLLAFVQSRLVSQVNFQHPTVVAAAARLSGVPVVQGLTVKFEVTLDQAFHMGACLVLPQY